MKDKIVHTAEWILVVILGVLLIYTAYKSYTVKEKLNYITTTDTIHYTNTITNWQHDTVYISRLDTIKLPVVDTINDTIIKLDSVLVQIPINTYVYDTTITDSTYRTSLRAVLSGFQCQMDSLYLNTEITPQKPQITHKNWYQHLCPAVGIGFGTGGFGIFAGIGYEL